MRKWIYFVPLKSVLGSSILHYWFIHFIHSNFNGYTTEYLSVKSYKALLIHPGTIQKQLRVTALFSNVLGLTFVLHM